ncbi:MAG: MFS transporter [Acidimicrobiales bacterium]
MAGPAQEAGQGDPRRWWVLAVVVVGTFMILLDTTIVNVAIPSIQVGLHAGYGAIEWVVSGYALAFGLVLIPAGRVGDRFGHRRLFLVSLAGFTVTSLLCGTSTSPGELVIWRVVQGAMAGILNPQILAAVQVAFAPRERGKAFAFYGATAGVATALGPLLGGLLVAGNLYGLDWRPIFLLNVPIGVAALVVALRLLPESRGRGGSLDLSGIVLVAVALLLVTYPLVEGRSAGWPPWALAALAATLPALALFALSQRRRIRRGRSPLVDIRLFQHRAFAAGTGLALTYFAGFTSVFFSLSLWLQTGLGRSALSAGLTILPFALGSLVGSSSSDVVARRLGPRVLQVGTAMVAIGLAGALAAIHLEGVSTSAWLLLPPLAFAGIGSGLTIAPNTNLVLARVPVGNAGAAGGVLSTAQRVGTALGIAVVGVLLFGALGRGAGPAAASAAPVLRSDLARAGVPAVARREELARFTSCFDRRAASADPLGAIPGCPGPGSGGRSPLSSSFAQASHLALAQDFTRAVQVSMGFNIAAVVLAFLMVLGFPSRNAQPPGTPGSEG